MATVTVADVNKALDSKGLHIKLPLPEHVVVTRIDILEKVKMPGMVKVLLRVKFLNEKGRETQEVFVCEGPAEVERKMTRKAYELPKKVMLPKRDRITFESDEEAVEYIRLAITSLLMDKGYEAKEAAGVDLYFEKDGKGFYVNLAVRLDDVAFERAKALVEVRRSLREKGASSDYALVVPSIQESLGLALRLQERWVARNQDYLSVQRVGVYGVDNQDPNTLYPFTIYPTMLDLKRYFMVTSQQWSVVRSRYVLERTKRERGESPGASLAEMAGGIGGIGGMGIPGGSGVSGASSTPPPPPAPPSPGL
ncbi:MAG: hypothetical protein AB1603_04025 [Chloroflexota bacterium]